MGAADSVGWGGPLETLLRDYEATRSEEYAFRGFVITVVALGVTVLGIIGGLTSRICQPKGDTLLQSLTIATQSTDCTPIPPLVLAMAPALPAAAIVILVIDGIQASFRSRYLRSLEVRIREYVGIADDEWLPAGLYNLLHQFTGGNTDQRSFRLLFALQWIPAGAVAIGTWLLLTAYIDSRPYQLLSLGGWGFVAFLTIFVWYRGYIALGHRWSQKKAQQRMEFKRARADYPVGHRAISWSVVLLPRKAETMKVLIAIGSVLVAWALTGYFDRPWRAIMAIVGFELVIYQARYAWNDIRDVGEDYKQVSSNRRARLERTAGDVRSALIAIAWRLVVVVLAFILLDGADRALLAGSLAVVSLSGAVYESSKADQTDEVTRATKFWGLPFPTLTVLLVVGLGYGFRCWLGFQLAGASRGPTLTWAAFGYALGLCTVYFSWALEGFASYGRLGTKKAHVKWLWQSCLDEAAPTDYRRYLEPLAAELSTNQVPEQVQPEESAKAAPGVDETPDGVSQLGDAGAEDPNACSRLALDNNAGAESAATAEADLLQKSSAKRQRPGTLHANRNQATFWAAQAASLAAISTLVGTSGPKFWSLAATALVLVPSAAGAIYYLAQQRPAPTDANGDTVIPLVRWWAGAAAPIGLLVLGAVVGSAWLNGSLSYNLTAGLVLATAPFSYWWFRDSSYDDIVVDVAGPARRAYSAIKSGVQGAPVALFRAAFGGAALSVLSGEQTSAEGDTDAPDQSTEG